MDVAHAIALVVFLSYFSIILALFTLVLHDLYQISSQNRDDTRTRTTKTTFMLLVIGSLTHTWYHMFRFLRWSFLSYESQLNHGSTSSLSPLSRLTSWLVNTSLFEQAWSGVCFGEFNWWWSQQLCLYTVGAWTIFLAIKGREHGIKHLWAYMLLGQLVAISVASNLFYLALALSESSTSSRKSNSKKIVSSSSASLYIPVFIALGAVFYSPSTSVQDGSFLVNLLAMHALLFLPLITQPFSGPFPRLPLKALVSTISIFSLALHLHATQKAWKSVTSVQGGNPSLIQGLVAFVEGAQNTLFAHHPAQSSIGWDVVWTSASFIVWCIFQDVPHQSVVLLKALPSATAPLLSVGSVAPWVFKSSAKGVKAGWEKLD